MVIKYREPGILSRFNYVIRSDNLLRVQLGFLALWGGDTCVGTLGLIR